MIIRTGAAIKGRESKKRVNRKDHVCTMYVAVCCTSELEAGRREPARRMCGEMAENEIEIKGSTFNATSG